MWESSDKDLWGHYITLWDSCCSVIARKHCVGVWGTPLTKEPWRPRTDACRHPRRDTFTAQTWRPLHASLHLLEYYRWRLSPIPHPSLTITVKRFISVASFPTSDVDKAEWRVQTCLCHWNPTFFLLYLHYPVIDSKKTHIWTMSTSHQASFLWDVITTNCLGALLLVKSWKLEF